MIKTKELSLSLAELRRLEHGLLCSLCQTKADDIEATVALMVKIKKMVEEIDSATMGNLKVEWVDNEQQDQSPPEEPTPTF